jgi:hypothetical protein
MIVQPPIWLVADMLDKLLVLIPKLIVLTHPQEKLKLPEELFVMLLQIQLEENVNLLVGLQFALIEHVQEV